MNGDFQINAKVALNAYGSSTNNISPKAIDSSSPKLAAIQLKVMSTMESQTDDVIVKEVSENLETIK